MNTKEIDNGTYATLINEPFANSVLNSAFCKETRDMGVGFSENPPQGSSLTENSNTAKKILTRLESKKKRAAVNLRISNEEVETLPFDLTQLETEGIFMNIDTHGFGSLTRQLDWKSLGVKLPENRTVMVSPPRAGLLPDQYRRKLMRGAAGAHNALKKYSFRFTLCETVFGTSDYKWIPWNAFEQFETDYRKACETLSGAKREVLENYDGILLSLRENFTLIAADSAKRLETTLDEPLDREDFIQRVVSNALGMVPTREAVRDSLIIEMKPKVIILGSEMVAEQSLRSSLYLEKERVDSERESVRLELDAKREIEQLKISDFESEQRREREVRERIRRMKIEAARREAEEAVSPVKEGFEQITGKIYEAALEMSEKMRSAEFVPGSLAKRARQMCEWYSLMNFTGDSSLEDVLEKLERAAGRKPKLRSAAEMQDALADVLRATTIHSKRLLDEDRLSALEL